MSDAQEKVQPMKDYRIPADNPWTQAWKLTAALGAIGVVMAAAGYASDPRRFAFSYLTGFAVVMTMGLGATFFVLIQHLTHAGWSVTVRRAAEFLSAGLIVAPVLFLPNLLSLDELYPWWSQDANEGVAHAQGSDEHGAEGEPAAAANDVHEAHAVGGHHTPEHAVHEATLEKKLAYLNPAFFGIRAVVVLLAWLLMTQWLFKTSTAQDRDGDPRHTVSLQRNSTWLTWVFALSLTLGGVDWFMSLEPNWFSTMYGVRVFGSSAVFGLAAIILLALGFRRAGVVKDEISVEHFHDLGKLMFGFLVFWAYVSFSEFMLIWYAAIPEETVHYHHRWDATSWRAISVSLVVVKFIIPFFMVMSRNAKRALGVLGFGAAWICALHIVEMYYWIMPYYALDEGVQSSVVGMVTDAGCILACVGIYLSVVFKRMLDHSVIPLKDPRLPRALDFVNA